MKEKENPSIMRDLEDWIKPEIVALLFNTAKKHNHRNWLILYLLLKTGRRISELLIIKPKDIDFESGLILWSIEKKKREYKKWKPADRATLLHLDRYIYDNQIFDEEYIFFSPYKGRNNHLSRQAVFLFLQKYSKKLNLNVHPHTFRHTFAVWIAQNMEHPSDLVKLKQLLEHSDIKMTEQYLQFSTKETKQLLDKTFKKFSDESL